MGLTVPAYEPFILSVWGIRADSDITIRFSQNRSQRLMIYAGPFLVSWITRLTGSWPSIGRSGNHGCRKQPYPSNRIDLVNAVHRNRYTRAFSRQNTGNRPKPGWHLRPQPVHFHWRGQISKHHSSRGRESWAKKLVPRFQRHVRLS
jgi:hypothetical protein